MDPGPCTRMNAFTFRGDPMTRNIFSRRDVLSSACSGAAALLLPDILRPQDKANTGKLNLIFILVDDLGWADLGCYGSDLHETPNIDRFAAEGMRFTQAYAAAPVCTPTRASIMTGKFPARLHMTIWSENSVNPPKDRKHLPPITLHNLPHEETTLAEALKEAGYATAHIGKWHLGDAKHYPETQGFDVNIGGTLWGAPNTFFYPYSGAGSFGGEFRYVPHLEFGKPGEYLTDRLTDEALRVIDRMKDNPFYLNLCYHTVHTPIEAKREAIDYYAGKIRKDMNHRNPVYAAMVSSLDENVGRILKKLDEAGLRESTIVILFSDNGGYINEYNGMPVTNNYPLRSGKGSLYEGGIRVPLIIRAPGMNSPGGLSATLVSSIDFFPTILSLLSPGGDKNQNRKVDGIDISSLLRDPGSSIGRNTLFWHYPHYYPTTTPVSAVRSGDWKLLEYLEDGKTELYNLREDMRELNNLANERPGETRKLLNMLHEWRLEVNAQMSAPNPEYKK